MYWVIYFIPSDNIITFWRTISWVWTLKLTHWDSYHISKIKYVLVLQVSESKYHKWDEMILGREGTEMTFLQPEAMRVENRNRSRKLDLSKELKGWLVFIFLFDWLKAIFVYLGEIHLFGEGENIWILCLIILALPQFFYASKTPFSK